MKTYVLFMRAAVVLLLALHLFESIGRAACSSSLQDRADVVMNPAGADYDVFFTDDDPTSNDFFSATNAGFVRDAVLANHNIYVNPPYSFLAPNFSESPNDICIFDSQNIATAPADRITVDAPMMRTASEPFTRAILGHELFHHVQNAYIDINNWAAWGGWTVEATARAMEDKTFTDNDSTPANTLYVGEVNNYMGNPNATLMDISERRQKKSRSVKK